MANRITIENPKSSITPIPVPGTPGNWTLPCVSGMAFVDTGTLTSVNVRICDPGNSASCKTPKTATTMLCMVFGGTSVYSWSANDVPVKNASGFPGAANEIWAQLTTSAGDVTSPAVSFTAVGMTVYTTLASYSHYKKVYRVRFDAGTLPPLFNRLASLGMNVSNRVKLKKSGEKWVSKDNTVILDIDGTTATILAEIQIAEGITVTQTWSCPDFHAKHGGVFSAQSPLIPVNLLVS